MQRLAGSSKLTSLVREILSWALRSSSCARPLDGDSDQATAALVPSRQQALVLELGNRGIDRSRAPVPGFTSAVALACMIW